MKKILLILICVLIVSCEKKVETPEVDPMQIPNYATPYEGMSWGDLQEEFHGKMVKIATDYKIVTKSDQDYTLYHIKGDFDDKYWMPKYENGKLCVLNYYYKGSDYRVELEWARISSIKTTRDEYYLEHITDNTILLNRNLINSPDATLGINEKIFMELVFSNPDWLNR